MDPLRHVRAAVSSIGPHREEEPSRTYPFITISRQAGAQGRTLMHALVERLRAIDTDDPPWTGWHRELVERVAADHDISASLIESIGDKDHSFLRQMFDGWKLADERVPGEQAIYRLVASTIRVLAKRGRVILVGRGGVWVTHDLPLGLHVRLFADEPHRARLYSEGQKISIREARRRIREMDQNRDAFYKQFWPKERPGPDVFDVTFNVERTSVDAMADAVVAMVRRIEAPTPMGATA